MTHGLSSHHLGNRETMIEEALTWAVRESIQRGRLGIDAATLELFAADVPALMADLPRDAVFQSSSPSGLLGAARRFRTHVMARRSGATAPRSRFDPWLRRGVASQRSRVLEQRRSRD